MSVDTHVPYNVMGAMQDLGTAHGPSNSLKGRNIQLSDWHSVGGGEAGYVIAKPDDPDIVYAGDYFGYLARYDARTGAARDVTPWPENPSGHGAEDMKYRFQWTSPSAFSPFDPNVLYFGAQVVFQTADGGQTWTAISPDLTRNDKSKQKWAGGPITGDNTGVETYDTVFAIAESPKQKGVIWAGSDDGLVHVTRDGGKTWTDVTGAMTGIPHWGTIDLIEPSPFDAGTAYVVVDNHRMDDTHPYLYKTADYGRSWTRLDGSLPQDVYLHAVREDPARRGLLYLGTERGVMFSPDDGTTWKSLRLNMPTVAVHDLVVKDDSLVVGTHGRSIWILDDLIPVRDLSAKIEASDAYLFRAADAVRWEHGTGSWASEPTGPNPPYGALLYYYLKEKPKGDVTIEILDAQGHHVRTLSSQPAKVVGFTDELKDEEEAAKHEALPAEAGVQRGVWDLRYDGAPPDPGRQARLGRPRDRPARRAGHLHGEADRRRPHARDEGHRPARPAGARVAGRPRGAARARAQGPRRRQPADRHGELDPLAPAAAREPHRDAEGQHGGGRPREAVAGDRRSAERARGRMQNPTAEVVYDILAMRGGSRLYSRIGPLMGWVEDGPGAPTQGMQQVFAEQDKELDGYASKLDSLVSVDLAGLNKEATSLGLGYVIVK